MTNNMWMIRAGEDAYLFQDFKKNGLVAIGWDIGDLTKISTLEEIKQLLRKNCPEYGSRKVNLVAGEIYRFRFEFKKDDNVITYDPEERSYL